MFLVGYYKLTEKIKCRCTPEVTLCGMCAEKRTGKRILMARPFLRARVIGGCAATSIVRPEIGDTIDWASRRH